jgi:Zn-dependent protease with chaperone function
MVFILSLLIQTGEFESNYIFRLLMFFMALIILDEDEDSENDHLFDLQKPNSLDISNIPSEFHENTAYALKLIEMINEYFPDMEFKLIYLHEHKGLFSRSPAFCIQRNNSCDIALSSSILQDKMFSRDEIRAIIFHELGHFLDLECQKNLNYLSFLRAFLLSIFYTHLSMITDPHTLDQRLVETILAFLLANTIIFCIIKHVINQLHQFEYFADSCSVTYGNVSRETTINTLKKLYFHMRKNPPSWNHQLYTFKFEMFSTHPSLKKRCEYISEFKESPNSIQPFFPLGSQKKNLSPIASEFGFIC